MIRLQTLGVLDLRDGKGEALEAVLRQPKRLALLAYLAVAVPHRFHRRDTLLALFWPEFDQEHARAALRRALHFLRSALGAEVGGGPRRRRGRRVGWRRSGATPPRWSSCSPRATARRALALYRGPLLDGLYVAGASVEFQDWLDRERIRLRERAADAARALVTQAESDGRLDAAAGWARRVLELAPDDEAALRRLPPRARPHRRAAGGAAGLRRVRSPSRPGARARAVGRDPRRGRGSCGPGLPLPRRRRPRSPCCPSRFAAMPAWRTCARAWSTSSPPSSTARATSAPSIRGRCCRPRRATPAPPPGGT